MSCFVDGADAVERKGVQCSHHDDAGHGCATKLLWTRVQGGMVEAMRRTTLAELIEFSSRSTTDLPLVTING
jgi:DNA-binding IscR family transcriptional regulator